MRTNLRLPNWLGYEVRGTLITGDWEGDSDVPNGRNYFEDYIDEITVYENGVDVTDNLSDYEMELATIALIEDGYE